MDPQPRQEVGSEGGAKRGTRGLQEKSKRPLSQRTTSIKQKKMFECGKKLIKCKSSGPWPLGGGVSSEPPQEPKDPFGVLGYQSTIQQV